MSTWERLPDRVTPKGEVLRTEQAKIGGVDWFVGTIPPQPAPERRRRGRLWKLPGLHR